MPKGGPLDIQICVREKFLNVGFTDKIGLTKSENIYVNGITFNEFFFGGGRGSPYIMVKPSTRKDV